MKFSDYFTTAEEETMPTRPADALALLQRQNTPALEPVEPPQDGDDGDDDLPNYARATGLSREERRKLLLGR